ncbi:MAG: GRP family sugar transporter [Candidatus Hadarchaeales archaeon]
MIDRTAFLLSLFSAFLWGTYCNPLKHLRRFGPWEFSNDLLLGGLLLSWAVFLLEGGGSWGPEILLPLLSGMVWAAGNYAGLSAIRELGLAYSYSFLNLSAAVAFFWGVLLFGEMEGGLPLAVASAGLLCMLSGAFLLGRSLEGKGGWRGVRWALLGALCFGTFGGAGVAASLKAGITPFQYCALIAVGAWMVYFLRTLWEGLLGPWWGGGRREHLLGFLAGFLWMGGNLMNFSAAPSLGVAVAFPIGTASTVVAVLWGVLYYREFGEMERRAKLLAVLGILMVLVGVVGLGMGRALA